ncbi:uncharacterized protein LOC111338177 isoform X1 [Stylophora pistillata]|uniref:uncharacterized protein LOC111338177 isoform X1 n=1 Tax=Stylophora pistillata TaxID=50429 RepID=UPI000C051AB7|nr:uncharacterized protein LOC111338177 isoform X1 [Stylophora pistillata]
MVNSASIMKKEKVCISILLFILICFSVREVSASPRPSRQDNSALSPDSAVLGGRVFTSATTRKTPRTISDDAQAIIENLEDIKSMESAANNNHANWEEIITRRAANEDILEHPDSDKKFPSNLKLKSLLKEAIKRGRDTAASQKAPGTDVAKSGIQGKTGQKSSGRGNEESYRPDDHPRIKGSESKPRGTSTEQKQERNTQPGNMASAGPRWGSAMDYGLKSHYEERKVKIKKKKKGRLESQTETKDPADNGSLIIVGGLIGGMFLFLAIGAVFYRIWKNCRKRIGRDRGDPERVRLSASLQAIAEDTDEDIIFERKPKGSKMKNKKEEEEDPQGKNVRLNLEVSQYPPAKGGHGREVRVDMEASDSSQPASLSSMSAPSLCSSFGTQLSTQTIGSSLSYITLIDSRKDSYLRFWMPQMPQSSGSSSSSDVEVKVEPDKKQAAPPQSSNSSAACRQLNSMVTTETGGSNSSSESCKTPVAVSDDVTITINDDDDCKEPLLSSENEGSSAEVIYVSRNHLTTEATEGDENDVKERSGEPSLPPAQTSRPSSSTDLEKSIILDEAMDKARDFERNKRLRIIRKGLSLRSDTSLSEEVALAQAVILPTPIDPKKMKRDKERPKVIKELLKEYINPSFSDAIQVVASTMRSDRITRDLRKQTDYKRYLIGLDAKRFAKNIVKPTFQMDIQFVRNVICGRSALDHGENPHVGCLCSYCVKQRSKTGRPPCFSIARDIPKTEDTFVINGKVFTSFVPKQSSSGNAGPGTSTGSHTAHNG